MHMHSVGMEILIPATVHVLHFDQAVIIGAGMPFSSSTIMGPAVEADQRITSVCHMPLQPTHATLPKLGARHEDGVFLGYADLSNELYFWTGQGVVKARSCRRRPDRRTRARRCR